MIRRVQLGAVPLVLVLSACGGGGHKAVTSGISSTSATSGAPTSEVAAGGSSTTAKLAGPAPAATFVGPGATSATTRAGTAAPRPATVNQEPAAAYRPPPGATAATPSDPGTYRYDTTGATSLAGRTSPYPSVTTLVVDPSAGTKQHSTRDYRDPQGQGSRQELFLDYQTQGVLLDELKVTTTVSGFTDVRDLRPASPAVLLPTGIAPGAHVEFDVSGSNTAAHVVLDALRRESVAIAGTPVDTLVFRIVATFSGEITGTSTTDDWIAPGPRLIVKEHGASDAGAGAFRAQSHQDSVLQRLTPS